MTPSYSISGSTNAPTTLTRQCSTLLEPSGATNCARTHQFGPHFLVFETRGVLNYGKTTRPSLFMNLTRDLRCSAWSLWVTKLKRSLTTPFYQRSLTISLRCYFTTLRLSLFTVAWSWTTTSTKVSSARGCIWSQMCPLQLVNFFANQTYCSDSDRLFACNCFLVLYPPCDDHLVHAVNMQIFPLWGTLLGV